LRISDDGFNFNPNFIAFFKLNLIAYHQAVSKLGALAIQTNRPISPGLNSFYSLFNLIDWGMGKIDSKYINAKLSTGFDSFFI
jgi:hypothetical protein